VKAYPEETIAFLRDLCAMDQVSKTSESKMLMFYITSLESLAAKLTSEEDMTLI